MRKLLHTAATEIGKNIKLLEPLQKNISFVNIWGPGYKIRKPLYDSNNKPVLDEKGEQKKVDHFISTSTFELAIQMLQNYYKDPKIYELHKQDVSPGHVSLLVRDSKEIRYLSIGPDINPEDDDKLGLFTEHELGFVNSFELDILSMDRFPLHQIDFYTLNVKEIILYIEYLKSLNPKYTLSGAFLSDSQQIAHNCVTSVHYGLLSGGLRELLPAFYTLMQGGYATPLMFKDLVQVACEVESSRFPIVIPWKKSFAEDMAQQRNRFIQYKQSKDSSASVDNTPQAR